MRLHGAGLYVTARRACPRFRADPAEAQALPPRGLDVTSHAGAVIAATDTHAVARARRPDTRGSREHDVGASDDGDARADMARYTSSGVWPPPGGARTNGGIPSSASAPASFRGPSRRVTAAPPNVSDRRSGVDQFRQAAVGQLSRASKTEKRHLLGTIDAVLRGSGIK